MQIIRLIAFLAKEILTRFIVNTNGRLAFPFVKKLLILKWNKFKEISGAPIEWKKWLYIQVLHIQIAAA